jgi:hypothetical protein
MSNVVNLKDYKAAKANAEANEAKTYVDNWSKAWIAYWFMIAGIK